MDDFDAKDKKMLNSVGSFKHLAYMCCSCLNTIRLDGMGLDYRLQTTVHGFETCLSH